jgi:hypothetical protein
LCCPVECPSLNSYEIDDFPTDPFYFFIYRRGNNCHRKFEEKMSVVSPSNTHQPSTITTAPRTPEQIPLLVPPPPHPPQAAGQVG